MRSKKGLKIDFVDFWTGFEKTNNFFYNLLSSKYSIVIDPNPDFIFFSCYGNSYLSYKCPRIFYSAENQRPDYTSCDLALTFDFSDSVNHFRLPLYVLYIDRAGDFLDLCTELPKDRLLENWNAKKKFCCIVVSNSRAKKRIQFFKELSSFCNVDSGGRFLNNIGDI